jgi:hypothetical protein
MSPRLRFVVRAAALFTIGGLATVQAADVDWGNAVFTSVNNLVDQDGSLFVHVGIGAVAAAGFLKLMWGLVSDRLAGLGLIAGGHVHFDIDSVVKTLFQVWVLTQILNYWSVPLPGSAHSIHQIPMYLSDQLVSGLAASKANQFMAYVKQVATQMDHPNPLALLDVAIYIFILANMGILSLATFLLTSFSYIGEAVFVVLTPLFLWCTFFHTVFAWCWNCVQNMFSFAAYKVVGGVIIYVLSDVMVNFFVNGVGNDYTIAHWIVLLPVVVLFTGLFVFSVFMVPLLCASIFNGAGAIGQAVTVAAGRFI